MPDEIINNPASRAMPMQRQARRLRTIGGGILLAGGGIAGLVYWLGMRSPELTDDPGMQGFNRVEQRQMNQLFGGVGGLIEDCTNAFKQPGTQALLIVIAAIVLAAGCFYFARRLVNDDADANQNNSPP
jgi:hypothetical protein